MREKIIAKTIELLAKKGFLVSTYLHSNNCFDLAAKKDQQLLLIKIFENIDATRPEQASELKRLSSALNATPIIVGEKTKTAALNDSVVYERYEIHCISINSFKEFLNQHFPKAMYFKGKTLVELDMQKLRHARQVKGITLSELARQLGLAPKSVHEYEKGTQPPIGIAKKLEKILSTPLIKEIDISKNNFKIEKEEIIADRDIQVKQILLTRGG